MIRGSPQTKPDLRPGTLERLERLWNTTQRSKRSWPAARQASSRPAGGGALVEVDLGVALVGGNDEVVPLGEGERTAQDSRSGSTLPVGLPGLHRNST